MRRIFHRRDAEGKPNFKFGFHYTVVNHERRDGHRTDNQIKLFVLTANLVTVGKQIQAFNGLQQALDDHRCISRFVRV